MGEHVIFYNKQLDEQQAELLAMAMAVMKEIKKDSTVKVVTPYDVFDIKID
ncbi:hypothetical protein D3C76_925890 [compost metagenome]